MTKEFFNQEAEQVILGSIIMNNNYLLALEFLKVEHFYFNEHQIIFGKILEAMTKSSSVDSTTLRSFFQNKDELGLDMLNQIISIAKGGFDIKGYGFELIELWQKRQLEVYLNNALNSLGDDFNDIKQDLDQNISDLSFALSKQPRKVGDIAREIIETKEDKKVLLSLGYDKTDKLTGGVALGSLFILAGRSSSGKTTMALNIARNLASEQGIIFFSIEVNDESLVRKIVTEQGSINPYRLKRGIMNQDEERAAQNSLEVISRSKMMIDDDSQLTLSKIRSKIKRISMKMPVKVICIDYLQLMTPEGKDFSREQQISKIVVGLKTIAKEFNILVIALSQLSRATDSRENKRPILSDLRDSGAIEQAADLVGFVHRDEYYLEREREPEHSKHYNEWLQLYNASKGKADFIIAKNRDGQIGDIKFDFDGQFSRFIETQ